MVLIFPLTEDLVCDPSQVQLGIRLDLNHLVVGQLKVIKNNGSVQYVNANHLTTKLITQANQIHAEEILNYKHLFKQM